MHFVELRSIRQYEVPLVGLPGGRGRRGALRVRVPPEHLQVPSRKNVKINRVGVLRECGQKHLHKDVELLSVAHALRDFLDELRGQLRPPSTAIISVLDLNGEILIVPSKRQNVRSVVEGTLRSL